VIELDNYLWLYTAVVVVAQERYMSSEEILWPQLLMLSHRPDLTLQEQLRGAIAEAVLDHRLPPGTVLPSSRRLAEVLGISRNTVMLAYELLAQDGFILARSRAQHIVDPSALQNAARAAGNRAESSPQKLDWSKRLLGAPSRSRHVIKPVDWYNYPYPFVYGQPDSTLFPTAEWREAMQLTLRSVVVRAWAGDQVDADDPVLIEQLQKQVLPRRGIWVSPDQILITVGAQQALYLTASLLLSQEKTVGLEQPCYPDIRNVCRQFGAQFVGLPMDQDGLLPTAPFGNCDLVFVQPSHQNPTSVTMSMARRRELLKTATAHDLLIVEDDYDSELTFAGEALPALKALDHDGRVIYVGSLSKTLAPGLRLGYLVAAPEFIAEARAMRRLAVRHPPANNQRAIAMFLQLGHYHTGIKRLIAAYRNRAAALAEGLRAHLPEIVFALPTGGSALWAEGPNGVSFDVAAKPAAAQGLLFDPGSVFFDLPTPPENFVRLGYSSIPIGRIDSGVQILARTLRAVQSSKQSDSR
jgi:GntR family transcriptional regulator / MocR family aminotransferase